MSQWREHMAALEGAHAECKRLRHELEEAHAVIEGMRTTMIAEVAWWDAAVKFRRRRLEQGRER